jgi:ParB-like chromosome segregation protein Spo0J
MPGGNERVLNELYEWVVKRGVEAANKTMRTIQQALGLTFAPVAAVQWVDVERVEANDYNPNKVAKNEMKLLEVSIKHDGYTQPVVAVYDKNRDRYTIVDGFHRYLIMKTSQEIREKYRGLLPVVVLNKAPKERMAATIRHNRARGKHTITSMGYLVSQMVVEGATDEEICNELGIEPDELVRLKHKTGVAALFKDREYSKSWKTVKQIEEENRG